VVFIRERAIQTKRAAQRYLSLTRVNLSAFWSPEYHPSGEIFGKILEMVSCASFYENNVLHVEWSTFPIFYKKPRSRNDQIKLILFVRSLRIGAGRRIQTNFHCSVPQGVVKAHHSRLGRQLRNDACKGKHPV
jgi:hypothetical protein